MLGRSEVEGVFVGSEGRWCELAVREDGVCEGKWCVLGGSEGRWWK